MLYCLLDMDGVISDFYAGAAKLHNREIDFRKLREDDSLPKLWGMSNAEFWKPIDATFWVNLPILNDAKTIVKFLESAFDDVVICSSSSLAMDAELGKKLWLSLHFPQFLNNRFIFTKRKELCASKYNVLIDDSLKNVQKFQEFGGRALLLPRPGNNRWHEDTMSELKSYVSKLK